MIPFPPKPWLEKALRVFLDNEPQAKIKFTQAELDTLSIALAGHLARAWAQAQPNTPLEEGTLRCDSCEQKTSTLFPCTCNLLICLTCKESAKHQHRLITIKE